MTGHLAFGLKGGFSPAQLQTVYDQTLLVLEKVGVVVDHDGILRYLASLPGVKVSDRRVRYAPDLVASFLPKIREENGDYTYVRKGEPDWIMRPAYMCLNSYDAVTGTITRASHTALKTAVKLCDVYQMSGTSPLHPQDLPEHVRQIGTLKICLENSRNIGRWMVVKNEREARHICAMAKLAGRTPPYAILQIPISPLRLNTEYLDIAFRHRESADYLDGITMGGGAIPMLGATGPLSAPAAWVQATAEAIASYMTVKLIDPRLSGVCSSNMFPFDLRRACMVIGSPEGALARLLALQINEHLFGFCKGSTFGSMGMPLDPQSSAEKMANILLEALAGTRVFYDAGMTPEDDMFCLEQLVFDREVVRWVRRLIEGLDYDDNPDRLLASMEEGVTAGNYLMHDDTLAGYRSFYWEPELFQYKMLSAIQAEKRRPSFAQRARAIVERDLSRHEFALPADVQKELDALYSFAERDLQSGK